MAPTETSATTGGGDRAVPGSVRIHRPGETTLELVRTGSGSMLDLLRDNDVDGVRTPCGGDGTCGKCLVRLSQPEGEARYALACRIPDTEADEVWLDAPQDLEIQADFKRPPRLAAWHPQDPVAGYSVAVDIGTTTVAAALIAPITGEVVAVVSDRNKQAAYGADVIARITRSNELGTEPLTNRIRAQLADLTEYLLESTGVSAAEVSWYGIAGNTVMGHLLDGLSPASIGVSPFTPLSLFGDSRPAADLGLPGSPDAQVYLLPAVAGYVGGDITAGILACGMEQVDQVVCLLDLGTNGEIALATPDRLVACATAAGPAFEGAQIECGMPAVAGAIDRVTVGAGQLHIGTIMRAVPTGICGSGLIDALAAALKLGLVEETGRLRSRSEVRPALHKYLNAEDEPARLLLTPDGSVFLSQRDIRQLQLAKGAIAAGLEVLLAEAGLGFGDVDQILLAGGFGTKVRARSLAAIGLIPTDQAHKTVAVGNAALAGASRAACDLASRRSLAELAERCDYLELSLDGRFTEAFMDQMSFEPAPVQSLAQAISIGTELGFEVSSPVDARTLSPMTEVRAMCTSDLCHSFGKNWACPPACGSLDDYAAEFASYREGMLVQTVASLEDQFDAEAMAEAERVHKRRFSKLVDALSASYPRLLPLGVGTCTVCPTCTYPAEPCKLPGLQIVSMEAAGLLVTEVCEKNDVPYYHGPLTLAYTSCVLID